MKVVVHLVALPWALVFQPSVALGSLKAYVDEYFDSKVECYTYSAFVEVLIEALGNDFIKYSDPMRPWHSDETILQVAYFEEFKRENLNVDHRAYFIDKIREEQKYFSLETATRLRASLKRFIERRIVPRLKEDSLNIIGFTMSMRQVYSSAFVSKYIEKNYPQFKCLFLYGGTSADSINVAKVFSDERIPGLFVIGEGERRIVNIIEAALEADSWNKVMEDKIANDKSGILSASKRVIRYERANELYEYQLDMDSLPEPDYSEYFDTLKRICIDSDTFNEFMKMVMIPLEGTRGCLGRCDFCGLNRVWGGLRKRLPQHITQMTLNKTSQHNCNSVMFVDSSCDDWAEEYADELISRGRSISTSMEMKARKSEIYWTKLALSGLKNVQIGVDALSPPLLKAIGKTTRVAHNVVVQKYLTELGIKSLSNIMAYHPKSTVEDINYTRYVIEHLPHLEQYRIAYFTLVQDSQFYMQLDNDARRKLRIDYRTPCKGKYKDLYISDFFKLPKGWLHKNVRKAWYNFDKWLEKRTMRLQQEPERLDVIECSDAMLWIRKSSSGKQSNFKYYGKYSVVYKNCHHGLRIEEICSGLNIPKVEALNITKELTSQKLMIEIEGIFISLALRCRDELIANLYRSGSNKEERKRDKTERDLAI